MEVGALAVEARPPLPWKRKARWDSFVSLALNPLRSLCCWWEDDVDVEFEGEEGENDEEDDAINNFFSLLRSFLVNDPDGAAVVKCSFWWYPNGLSSANGTYSSSCSSCSCSLKEEEVGP